jgi:DMSO/TMAO reductase YedYZ molybdopterin-dependent catalytic subunit
MKMTIRWKRFASCVLLLSLTWMLCLRSIDSAWTQDKTGDAVGANLQADGLLDLGGDVPNPRRIDASELHKLPRAETRTTDPHDPAKEIVYSGTPLVEVLKAGGLLLDSGMASIRETVTMTVLVEATDGYRAVFSLAELDPELTDRVILLADTKDGQSLPPREGPFRVIVPGEKRPARWVRQVKAVTVRNGAGFSGLCPGRPWARSFNALWLLLTGKMMDGLARY